MQGVLQHLREPLTRQPGSVRTGCWRTRPAATAHQQKGAGKMEDRTALVALRLMIQDLHEAGTIADCRGCPLSGRCLMAAELTVGENSAGKCGTFDVEREYLNAARSLLGPPAVVG